MWRWFFIGTAIGVFAPIVGGGLIFRLWQQSDLVAIGVRVQGVNIGGMSSKQAKQALERAFPVQSLEHITAGIFWRDQIVKRIRLSELGVKPDFETAVKAALQIGRRVSLKASLAEVIRAWRGGVHLPMPYKLNEESARQILKQIAQSLNRPAQRALVELVGENVHVIPSKVGIEVRVDESLNLWRESLAKGRWETLPLVVSEIEPEVKTEDVISIDGIVGKATTNFRVSDRNRTHNIRLAASRLDHTLIRPGETVSFNEIVGPRTPKRGFRVARVLVRGQFTEDFGGGVCQVAGTLYLAALRAGMEVVQRHRHSRPVEYLPPGLDATVNFGSLDLKLRNPFDSPLYLRTFVKGGRLTVLVLGKQEKGVTYRLVRQVERFGTIGVKQIPDPNLPLKVQKIADKGSVGYRVVVWRLKVENGSVTKREQISTDIYPPRPKLIRVGTARMLPSEVSPPTSSAAQSSNGLPQSQNQEPQANEQAQP